MHVAMRVWGMAGAALPRLIKGTANLDLQDYEGSTPLRIALVAKTDEYIFRPF